MLSSSMVFSSRCYALSGMDLNIHKKCEKNLGQKIILAFVLEGYSNQNSYHCGLWQQSHFLSYCS